MSTPTTADTLAGVFDDFDDDAIVLPAGHDTWMIYLIGGILAFGWVAMILNEAARLWA